MKNMKLIIIVLLLAACDGINQREGALMEMDITGVPEEETYESMDIAVSGQASTPATRRIEAKIMREASLTFEVKELEGASIRIKKLNEEFQARTITLEQQSGTSRKTIYLTVEVNPDSLERYLDQLKEIAIFIDRQNISSTDVTAEYVDIAARLRNRKAVEQRYRELLTKAAKVEDILKIEKALQEISEEVEAAQARKDYYDQRVAMSTVRLDFYEKMPVYHGEKQRSFGESIISSLDNGWALLLSFIIFMVNLWPFFIIGILALIVFIRWKRVSRISKHNSI